MAGTLPKALLFAVGEKQCLRGDINCHRKLITVPVTVVLGLIAAPERLRVVPRNPRQMTFCFGQIQNLGCGTCTLVTGGKLGSSRGGPAFARGSHNKGGQGTMTAG